jgi:hypothetical protein
LPVRCDPRRSHHPRDAHEEDKSDPLSPACDGEREITDDLAGEDPTLHMARIPPLPTSDN